MTIATACGSSQKGLGSRPGHNLTVAAAVSTRRCRIGKRLKSIAADISKTGHSSTLWYCIYHARDILSCKPYGR